MTIKFYRHYLIYKYNLTFSLFCMTCKLTTMKNHLKKGNFYFQALFNIFILTSLTPKIWRLVVHDYSETTLIRLFVKSNTSHKFWEQSPSPHYQCCLQVSETVSWHKLRYRYPCQYAATLSRGKGLDLFLQRRPFKNFHNFFQDLAWSQRFMWDIVTKFEEVR